MSGASPEDGRKAEDAPLTAADGSSPPTIGVSELVRRNDGEVYRRLVDSVRDYAIFLLTPEGNIASWNSGARRIKQYTEEEVLGKHFSIFYTEEALARGWPAEELRRASAHGQLEDEGWRVRKDGSQFWANVVISAVRGDQGNLLGFSKVTRDLTERREHERQLAESERSLRLLVDGVQDYAIFQLDPTGTITSWNAGAQRIKGYAASEAIGQHFSVFYPPEAIASGWPAEELRRAAQRGRFEDEGWRLRKNGTRIWANVVITAIRDQDGSLIGYSKVTRDLTERRRQEDALREREESLRLLVEGTRDLAMFLLDVTGRIRTWNPGGQSVYGYASEAVIEKDYSMLFTLEDAAAGMPQAELLAAKGGGLQQAECWQRRADGTAIWCECSLTLLRDAAGRPRALVKVVRDLSDRRRVEQLEVEGKRTTEFIAMLSHELRNPLVPMRNAMAVLNRGSHSKDVKWAADMVSRQVSLMSRLVDDLLDLSRIANGRVQLMRAPLDLRKVVEGALDATRGVLEARSHRSVLEIPESPVMVEGDEARLTQVFVNILSNAAKYTPPHGHVTVSLDDQSHFARLRVSDTGVGMHESLLKTAFDAFVQGERTLDRSDGGMGIGLTLVKRIVELHGGTVALASPGQGRGTTVTLLLPIAASQASPEEAQTTPEPATSLRPSKRILVVDDNVDAADSTATLLRMDGHEVQVAYDGHQALSFAKGWKPDIVLLDVGLPGISGLEVARRLREIPGMAGVRMIAVTGYGQASDIAASKGAGLDFHLTKPYELDELTRLLV